MERNDYFWPPFVLLNSRKLMECLCGFVVGDPTEAETEKISALWHSSLFNANIETQRCVCVHMYACVCVCVSNHQGDIYGNDN